MPTEVYVKFELDFLILTILQIKLSIMAKFVTLVTLLVHSLVSKIVTT